MISVLKNEQDPMTTESLEPHYNPNPIKRFLMLLHLLVALTTVAGKPFALYDFLIRFIPRQTERV